MKKKLEAELISIAHRILKLKSKSDINQLYHETQKLYEKLAILKFVAENFDEQKPTIDFKNIQEEVVAALEDYNEPIQDITPEIVSTLPEETIVERTKLVSEEPQISLSETVETEALEIEEDEATVPQDNQEVVEAKDLTKAVAVSEEQTGIENETVTHDDIISSIEEIKISEGIKLDDITEEFSFRTFSDLKPIPEFATSLEEETISSLTSTEETPETAISEAVGEQTPEDKKLEEEIIPNTTTKSEPQIQASLGQILFEDFGLNFNDTQFIKVEDAEVVQPTIAFEKVAKEPQQITETLAPEQNKSIPLNEKLAKGFHIDLNDRIAFTKHLFNNSSEDYGRVLNQMLTFDSFEEAKDFLETMVKPDYNDWAGKEDYAERFMEIVEKKFS